MQDAAALRKLFFSMVAVYLVMMCFTGLWPWLPNTYNSYALQAQSWLLGRLDLGSNYSYLELAIYHGRYYVSFPPFPSMLLLPFVFLFGADHSPDNLITLFAAFVSAYYAYKICRKLGRKNEESVFWALFVTIGSNLLFITICGWVWFMAQSLSFAFCLGAAYLALTPRFRDGFISLALFACAIGCRPFQIIYFPLLAWLLLKKIPGDAGKKAQGLWWLVIPLVIGGLYAALNYARFGNALEFGHNYLPEFTGSPLGQFNLAYVPENLSLLFHLPPIVGNKIQFPMFNGSAFFLISPIFLSYIILLGLSFWRRKELQWGPQILIPLIIVAHLIMIACHKTLGGWHFGNRYTLDVVPFLFLGLVLLRTDHHMTGKLAAIHYALFLGGLCLNIIGTIAAYNHWI